MLSLSVCTAVVTGAGGDFPAKTYEFLFFFSVVPGLSLHLRTPENELLFQ